ncbi:MAG: ribosome biogenesis GTPase Der [Bacteroidota bacterium]|nr:ribosome biogenesis GTPase Der [Bacteroidota bacterium]
MSNIVAIVGRPNVGKSTLFNRLIGERQAIVDDVSGVTRDRHYGVSEWNGREFVVVDTGGYVSNSDDVFEKAIRAQVEIAIAEADILLFMVDVVTGITDQDFTFAQVLRKSNKPILVVTNKVDNYERLADTHEFYKFGFEELFSLSSINGSGTGELLDRVVELLPVEERDKSQDDLPKFAILGRPNVGKSTLINTLIGEDRNIVSNIPGTTRDSINTHYNKFGKEFILIDTAGIRKKGKVTEDIEFYSVMRAIKALEAADLIFLVIDAVEGFESQDQNIFQLADKRGKGIVILVNKWDLVEKDNKTLDAYTKEIKEKIAPFTDVPIMFISAIEKTRIYKAVDIAMEVYENRKKRISTSELNEMLQTAVLTMHPPSIKGKFIKIKYATQVHIEAPTFAFFANHPQYIREDYKRYIENKLREHFNFSGVPLKLFFRKK